jgi:hypothetical protein
MEHVVPWGVLVQVVDPYDSKAKTGRPPFPVETMLRIHYLQQWFGLSDPAMEEALHDVPLYREFARLEGATDLAMVSCETWRSGSSGYTRRSVAAICHGDHFQDNIVLTAPHRTPLGSSVVGPLAARRRHALRRCAACDS